MSYLPIPIPILALGFLLGGTTAAFIFSFLYSRAINTLAAEHHTRQQQAYAQGYQDRALLSLQPPTQAPPDHWPAITQARLPKPRSLNHGFHDQHGSNPPDQSPASV